MDMECPTAPLSLALFGSKFSFRVYGSIYICVVKRLKPQQDTHGKWAK